MLADLAIFTFVGLASAVPLALDPAKHLALPRAFDLKDLLARDEEPCKILSEAYKAKDGMPNETVVLDVPPSVGIACLKSVPLDKKRDLELLDYLIPYVEFQSTIEVLADPPEEYLIPGVDMLGGIEVIRTRLKKDEYSSQYDMLKDLRSLFTAAHDGHFFYFSALLHVMSFYRPGFSFASVSSDGTRLPEVFMLTAALRGNKGELDYHPSAVSKIDGIPVTKWLEDNSMYALAGAQDPDAMYNTQVYSLSGNLTGANGIQRTTFEIPDSHTITFRNGTEIVIENQVQIVAEHDFTDIENGDDVHKSFELPLPVTTTSSAIQAMNTSATTPTAVSTSATPTPTTDHIPNYPYPVVKDVYDIVSGYFLNDTGYDGVAVLSIRSFSPIGAEDPGTEFILEGRKVVASFLKAAAADGRTKLVIDMSSNGGGRIDLANEFYRLLFPDGWLSGFDRYRATPYFDVLTGINYPLVYEAYYNGAPPVDVNGKEITNRDEWFGPYALESGQNMTAASLADPHRPWSPASEDPKYYFNGEQKNTTLIPERLFEPENILIVTDGYCASACTIFTGLLTRNHGVRTLALGGRPVNQAMQAMGGVKGTGAANRANLVTILEGAVEYLVENEDTQSLKTLVNAKDVLPSVDAPPLRDFSAGFVFNSVSSYTKEDLDGYPVHFRYEAANCRLFFTQQMLAAMPEQWRRAADVAWNGAQCVPGSTTNSDGTMGDETLEFDKSVRSKAKAVSNPGWP